jgi:hypothetical protein
MERHISASRGAMSPAARSRSAMLASLMAAAIGLTACNSSDTAPAPGAAALSAAPALPPITPDDLVGKWGLGSFRVEADLARTTDEARRFCNNPYIITKGPNGGVMMYLADQSQPSELFIKNAAGRVYVGLRNEPAGSPRDRQITSFQDGVMVAAWVDPAVTARYGTMVFVRCPDGTSPARTASRSSTPAATAQ